MKITTGILVAGLMTGGLWAQNPNIINNTQSTMNTVQTAKTNDSNAALGISSTPSAKPAAQSPAGTQVKPAACARLGEERANFCKSCRQTAECCDSKEVEQVTHRDRRQRDRCQTGGQE